MYMEDEFTQCYEFNNTETYSSQFLTLNINYILQIIIFIHYYVLQI